MWRRTLYRPSQALVVALLFASVLSIVGLGGFAVRGRSRLRLVRARVEHSNHIRQVELRAQESLLAGHGTGGEVDPAVVRDLRTEVEALASSGLVLDPENVARMRRLSEVLSGEPRLSRDRLVQVVAIVNRVLESETTAQAELWRRMDDDASAELDLVLGISVAVPLVALIAYWFGRRWFIKPLVDLRVLLNQLASGERRQVDREGIHPVLVPLFDNYNRLVTRLGELEEEHVSHARMLEVRIRQATAALLEQQATLARAERLAAVGETTACLAHELRNPLAGIMMSLGNLRSDIDDPDMVQRVDVVIEEMQRLTRLLNDSLSAARHAPEALRVVGLHGLVDELLKLLRYQVPPRVELVNAVDPDVECVLPRDRVRQALLNLILNSVHAIDQGSGSVTVTANRRGDRLELLVEDDGPGFPTEMLSSGIRAFVSRSSQGSGLGLAMVRRTTLDLGGKIDIENRESGGARVRLELPCGHA